MNILIYHKYHSYSNSASYVLADCFDVSQMGNITLELVRRGYSAKEIKKIWGGNLTRVIEEFEAAAI